MTNQDPNEEVETSTARTFDEWYQACLALPDNCQELPLDLTLKMAYTNCPDEVRWDNGALFVLDVVVFASEIHGPGNSPQAIHDFLSLIYSDLAKQEIMDCLAMI